jgi:hypothetical protein
MAGNSGGRSAFAASGPTRRSVTIITVTKEASVDLALKLNVLALCAACLFVGAVLLGAF